MTLAKPSPLPMFDAHYGQDALRIVSQPEGTPSVTDQRFHVRLRKHGEDWQNVPVYRLLNSYIYNHADTAAPHFAMFESSGVVEVEVKSVVGVGAAKLRPGRHDASLRRTGNTMWFTMNDARRYLCLEINGDRKRPLLLFSNPVCPPILVESEEAILLNGTLSNGVLFFGPGYHRIAGDRAIRIRAEETPIHTIYLAAGAVVEGWLDIEGMEGLAIKGSGVLFNRKPPGEKGPPVIRLQNCSHISVNGIVCVNQCDNWSVKVIASHDVDICGLKLISEIRDGVNLLNSQRVAMRDSFIMAHDDVVCLKGVIEGENQPVEDILVERCVLANMGGGNGIELGYESVTPVYQRITYRDIDIIYCLSGACDPQWPEAAIAIHPTCMTEYERPEYMAILPPVRDVTFQNISIEACEDAFYIDIRPNRESPGAGIERILLENICITDSERRPSRIVGSNEHPIRDVTVRGLSISGVPIKDAESSSLIIDHANCVTFELNVS